MGVASLQLGAGRMTKEDEIDLLAGIELHLKVGSKVSEGDTIATLHTSTESKIDQAVKTIEPAIEIQASPVEEPRLIHGRVAK